MCALSDGRSACRLEGGRVGMAPWAHTGLYCTVHVMYIGGSLHYATSRRMPCRGAARVVRRLRGVGSVACRPFSFRRRGTAELTAGQGSFLRMDQSRPSHDRVEERMDELAIAIRLQYSLRVTM